MAYRTNTLHLIACLVSCKWKCHGGLPCPKQGFALCEGNWKSTLVEFPILTTLITLKITLEGNE